MRRAAQAGVVLLGLPIVTVAVLSGWGIVNVRRLPGWFLATYLALYVPLTLCWKWFVYSRTGKRSGVRRKQDSKAP